MAEKEVIIFLDVDGVLNEKWIGQAGPSSGGSLLSPRLLANLVALLGRLEAEQGLEPVIVLSTTWRLEATSRGELLSSLAKIEVGKRGTLRDYLNGFGDGDGNGDDAGDVGAWATPDLGHGTGPEGRAAEIQAWLGDRCRSSGVSRSDVLFLVLDDLDLLYTETGKRNDSISAQNFVCTVSYAGHGRAEGEVGLTSERVEEALRKVRRQSEERARRRSGTGRWTEDEWVLLRGNPALRPHLPALRSDSCPEQIAGIARGYIEERTMKGSNADGGNADNGNVLSRFWRWCRRRS